MTWTYGGDPAGDDRDRVRFLAGLTVQTPITVSDEEIAYILAAESGSHEAAAASILDTLAVRYATAAETLQLGRRREEYGDRAKKLAERAAQVRTDSGLDAAGPIAPQILLASRRAALSSTTRTPTQFRLGMHRVRNESTTPPES